LTGNRIDSDGLFRPFFIFCAMEGYEVMKSNLIQSAVLLALLSFATSYAGAQTTSGAEFQVNSYTTSEQDNPTVASGADGSFVVVWHSNGSPGSDSSNYSILGQRCSALGSALGGEFQINTYTTGYQTDPAVSSDSSGNFVVAWSSNTGDGSGYAAFGQRYSTDGSAIGGEFQINTYTTSDQFAPSIAVASSGAFVVAWTSIGSNGPDDDNSICGQRYASGGSELGAEFQINTYTTSSQESPSVATDGSGKFVVVWGSYGSSGSDTSS